MRQLFHCTRIAIFCNVFVFSNLPFYFNLMLFLLFVCTSSFVHSYRFACTFPNKFLSFTSLLYECSTFPSFPICSALLFHSFAAIHPSTGSLFIIACSFVSFSLCAFLCTNLHFVPRTTLSLPQ